MRSRKDAARLKHLTWAHNYDYIEHENAMLSLVGLSEEIFYMPYTREQYEEIEGD